ncbi:YggS family pyridoxal phosphate-dependent enzyme [Candidatus Pelagibacter sp.]|nr:YggS family pyridoxal phosphate-dependent enzyme [Candidatus Pelagibacter sp.]
MHNTVQNLIYIEEQIKSKIKDLNYNRIPKIIAVSKTFTIDKILPLIDYGHIDYGENKVQEAIDKWTTIKAKNENIKLHLIGKLQTNKVKLAVKIFDYIHSVDTEKLAIKIANEQLKQDKKVKVFIQINIGNEEQKSGVKIEQVSKLYNLCKKLNLNVLGMMCIPPKEDNSQNYFLEMNKINKGLNLTGLSMGMSEDYLEAAQNNATFLRIGSKIFGQRD